MAWCELLTVITQKNYATYTHAHGYFKAKIHVKSTGFWEAGDARAFVNFLANTWQRNTLSRQQKLQNLYYLTLKSCSRNPARLLFMAWCKLLTVITQKNYATYTHAHGYFKAKIQVKSTGFWEAGDARAFVNFSANTYFLSH